MNMETLTIKLMSAAIHAEEHIETGEPLDLAAFKGIMSDPEIVGARQEMDRLALLPVKRP